MGTNARSGTKDDIIAAALAAGRTYREAGEAAGVSERTVRRRLQEPRFAAQVKQEQAMLVKRVADGLAGSALAAVETLQSLLLPASPPVVRCRAAQAILSSSRTWRDAADSEDRIVQLEKSVAAMMMVASLP